ncbi:CHAT domain-containing protein [Embleya sp. NPDC008237]|uniref:CHAT domain-containing protein n=1 Tax=Embleya sp. NPDC008237 TaxID=3363978 RepID=UPI0036E63041
MARLESIAANAEGREDGWLSLIEPASSEALAEVDELVPVPFDNLDASYAAGRVLWLRRRMLGDLVDPRDRDALELRLGAVCLRSPDLLDPETAAYFAENAPACCVARALTEGAGTRAHAAERMIDAAVETARTLDGADRWPCHSHATHLALLAQCHVVRFDWFGRHEDLAELIRLGREANRLVTGDDPFHGHVRVVYAHSLFYGLRVGGSGRDLNEAIEIWDEVTTGASEHDTNLGPYQLNDARVLRLRAEWTGSRSDLEAAIRRYREAVTTMTTRNHPDLGAAVSGLGNTLRVRYELLGHRTDLDLSIEIAERAVQLPFLSRATSGLSFAHLALARYSRHTRTGDVDDINGAVAASEAALDLFDRRSPERGGLLATHSRYLQVRAGATGRPEHEDAAVAAAATALRVLEAIGLDESVVGSWVVAHLAHCDTLLARARRTGSTDVARDALAAAREAVERCEPTSTAYADALTALGNAHAHLAEAADRSGTNGARERVLADEAYRRAAAHDRASPTMAAQAAAALGLNAARGGDWDTAADAYTEAVERLLRIAPAALRRADREYRLTALRGIASNALACCLAAGRVADGVRLFERGRGVILRQALDAHADLAELDSLAPELAVRFRALQHALAESESVAVGTIRTRSEGTLPKGPALGELPDTSGLPSDPVERRQWIETEIDVVVRRIRTDAAMPGFLAPPDLDALSAAAGATGTIVVVNVSEFRSDAVLLRAGRAPEALPLPGLTPAFAAGQTASLMDALDVVVAPGVDKAAREAAEDTIGEVLGDLWDIVTGPVLEHLGHRTVADGAITDRPRVWWCPAGPLTALPLHAAGHHETRSDATPLTVPDRVVSSYTPTLDALLRGAGPPESAAGPVRTLVVATATDHGAPADAEAPNTLHEANVVTGLAPGPVDRLVGPHATHDRVRAALLTARRAHFACHADTDPMDPAAGRLRLADHTERPFDVTAVCALHLADAEFAFLAACSTAAPGFRNPDEAVHLTSAFRLAGFRQVVGTLWRLRGKPTLPVVEAVYETVAAEGLGAAAGALHEAVLGLRDNLPGKPSIWATHLHVGGAEPTADREESS